MTLGSIAARTVVCDDDRGDDSVAVIIEGNGKCGVSRAIWIGNRIRPAAAVHPRDADRVAGPQHRRLVTHQTEIAQAIQFVVIGYAGRAIAEADFGADIEVDLDPAISRPAPERLALAPLIGRKRPLHLGPNRMAGVVTILLWPSSGHAKYADAPTSPPSPNPTTAATMVVLFIMRPAAIGWLVFLVACDECSGRGKRRPFGIRTGRKRDQFFISSPSLSRRRRAPAPPSPARHSHCSGSAPWPWSPRTPQAPLSPYRDRAA